ncbi:MAG TPA: PAS domain-containing sensor histidine kinase [Thermoanaerobaculia bacterium]|nr:PAS domain-containing sensor histidine kinase [Thermoanaerobaculia bacterium]
MSDHSSTKTVLPSDVLELRQRALEHEELVRALQGGEIDAVVILDKDNTSISRFQTDEPLYRTMVEALPQSVATVLPDGTIVYANRHLCTMTGTPSETLLGRNLLEVVGEKDKPRFTDMLLRALEAPQEAGISFRWSTGEAPALVSAIRLPIPGSDAVGLIIVDVRDQVARRAAEEASRAKDELLASVSHELRTPLTSIMGWIQLLEIELGGGDANTQPALQNLKNAVAAETKIVDELLDFAHAEKGSLQLVWQDFDLRQTLRVAASFVEVQAEQKGVTLNIDLPDEALDLRGDPDRLRQVFLNLLTNAVKFTAEGGVSIRCRSDDRSAIVAVSDSGIGIIPEFIPLVFEPFRRSERAQGFPGLGIGMAISRRIVEAHGGTIEVASAGTGQGATFTVRIPLVAAL